jgi:Zn-dependent membrane protease YugP
MCAGIVFIFVTLPVEIKAKRFYLHHLKDGLSVLPSVEEGKKIP